MARIRTIKPEAFESEDLASVDVTAVLTFFGLLTHADDAGRHRDIAAIIAGRLWALRPEHTPAHVAQDLEQLAERGLICRYTGCDGKTWLHIVTWERHQKINRPSASRLPRCPQHDAARACGECGLARCPGQGNPRYGGQPAPDFTSEAPARRAQEADSVNVHCGLIRTETAISTPSSEEVTHTTSTAGGVIAATSPEGPHATPSPDETAGQSASAASGGVTAATFTEGSRSGSRILDLGSSRRGREAPAPGTSPDSVLETVEASTLSAKMLIAEYVRGCGGGKPPRAFLGHLGRMIRELLDEGFEPEVLRPALERLRAKSLHPSVLPSLVNEAINPPVPACGPASASGAGPWSAASPAYTPYMNPAAPTGTFGVAL
ncbi:hypothetical protein ACGFRB_23650 [Streptomyces sp. NPDC048718]|uniref:hypothetical protein n=1 Tax=Streptomyces sp. NPDC048718 TaxID=3365587 RepID=UPI003715A5C2